MIEDIIKRVAVAVRKSSVDGHCSYCQNQVLEDLQKALPEWAELLGKTFKETDED